MSKKKGIKMGSKSKSTTTSTTVYGNTTSSNPYAKSHTDNKGTTAEFQDGTAFQSIYDFMNKNANSLLEEYLKPNLNSVTNQAKLNTFMNTLSNQTRNNLENDIINPLSNRNMIRSSQASDLYKNLTNQNIASLSNYINDLLSTSQNDAAKMLVQLMSYYMLGANYLSDMQNHSLNASQGNATRTNTTEKTSGNLASDLATIAITSMLKSML